MPGRRVVITGMGVVSPIGHTKEEFWAGLMEGKSGISLIDHFDVTAFPTKIAAQVKDFNVQDYIPRKEARRMDLFVQYACAAARMAMDDAKLTIQPDKAERTGVWVGSGIGGLETIEKQHTAMLQKGPEFINPFFIPMLIANMAAGQVSIMTGAKGPNGCTVTACASGSNSIGEAYQLIKSGKADAMISGGTEASVTPLGIGGFCALKALSVQNEEPAKASRPFDLNRDGFVMGEGAGILILEELEHALERGARIYAELVGYGASADACHMVQPDPEGKGAAQAFRMALAEAGVKPEEVDYINAHGTGTSLNDIMETRAIKEVFGDYSHNLLVSSTKGNTGHMLGAAGAIELIAAVLALTYDIVPPTLNLEIPDPECDLDYVPQNPRKAQLDIVMSDSLGFGGHNAVLVIRKFRQGI